MSHLRLVTPQTEVQTPETNHDVSWRVGSSDIPLGKSTTIAAQEALTRSDMPVEVAPYKPTTEHRLPDASVTSIPTRLTQEYRASLNVDALPDGSEQSYGPPTERDSVQFELDPEHAIGDISVADMAASGLRRALEAVAHR